MTFGRLQLHVGMEVAVTGGAPVGRVAEVRDEEFRVERPGQMDVWVPYEAIRALLGTQLVVDASADEIDARFGADPGASPQP